MNKKAEIFLRNFDGSGALTITWADGPYGDAIEAEEGKGVGFFSPNGDLLCVEFDDVVEKKDRQILKFDRYRVEADVNNGKVSYTLTSLDSPKKVVRSSKKSDQDAA